MTIKMLEHHTCVQDTTSFFFVYCCLHYFYLGKLYNNIKYFDKFNSYFKLPPDKCDLSSENVDSIHLYGLYTKLYYGKYEMMRNFLSDDIVNQLPDKLYTPLDMIDCIKSFAIKHENILYWR